MYSLFTFWCMERSLKSWNWSCFLDPSIHLSSIPSCRSTNHHDTPPKFGRWILLKIVYVGFCGGSVCSGSIGCNVFCLFGLRYACQLVPSLVTFVASMNLMYVYTRILLCCFVCAPSIPRLWLTSAAILRGWNGVAGVKYLHRRLFYLCK